MTAQPWRGSGRAITFGICPDNQWEDFRATVRRAPLLEAAGFDVLWLGDHTLPFQHSRGFNRSVIVELGAYLQTTDRVVVGAQVIAPIGLRRQPVDVALDPASLALLRPSRADGRHRGGDERAEHDGPLAVRERMERCVEGMRLIRRCWEEDGYFRHDGTYFSSFFTLYTKPSPPIPLICAANGPVLAGHAGRFADGICSVGVTPERPRPVLPAFEAGAREAGRDPRWSAWSGSRLSYHPDLAEAARRRAPRGRSPGRRRARERRRPPSHGGARQGVDETTIRAACCVASTADEIVATFRRYLAAGATHVIWGDLSPEPDLVPDLAREAVIPRLRAAAGRDR